MTSNSGHVFISHGSENRDEAVEICGFLEERGIKTWIAPRDVRPGMDYSEQLQSAIEECLAFVVLVSDMANKSPYVRAETEMAFSNSKPIFPVRRSDIAPASGLAFFLKIRHWTDAFGKDGDASMDRLALELRSLSGLPLDAGPAGPPPAPAPPPPPPPAPVPPTPAPPTPPPAPATPAEVPADEARLRAAIGPKADHYLDRWRRMDEKQSPISWNWPACLANFFWFAYRKLWVLMGAMGFAIILSVVLGLANEKAGLAMVVLLIGATFATGAFGDFLYRAQVTRMVAETAGMSEAAAIQTLAAKGGVSRTALIASIAATLLAVALGVALAVQQMELQPPAAPGPTPPASDPVAPSGDTQASAIDPALVPGRWTDTGDCADALEYTADGRVIAPDGATGLWRLEGDQLTVTAAGGTQTVRITSLDQSAAYAVSPDGTVQSSQRC